MLIALVGLPGGGKSTVGRQLARRLGVAFADSDTHIEQRIGESIRAYFEREGEERFRDVEESVIAGLAASHRGVMATGGGSVLRAANRDALHRHATVVYLRSTPEELFRRLRRDTQRPLLQVNDPLGRLRELHTQRDPLYRSTAHFVVETGRPSVPLLVNMILMQLELAGLVDAARVPSPVVRRRTNSATWRSYTSPMNTPTQTVRIDLGERSYDILIGSGLLARADSYAGLGGKGDAVVVTNETVSPLLYARVLPALEPHFRRVHLVELPDGEAHKNWQTLNRIFDAMLAAGCDRNSTLFALGGGVVGDMTGFAAACYMRGVPFVQLPTTLLSQVDSSVGGKTGINHPLGKNMVGAFHQPQRVVIDLDTLSTLPDRELGAGLAEVIKYGPIADLAFLDWLERNLDDLLARRPEALAHAVKRSCEIKGSVVGADERESGLRAILNFGHTFGHAIEAGLGYGEWLHGEAVGCGMVMASDLSARLGLISSVDARRIAALVARARLPMRAPRLGAERYIELMRHDKKSAGGEIRFVLIDPLGSASLRGAPDEAVKATISDCCE